MRTAWIALTAFALAAGSQAAAQSPSGSLVIRHDDLNLASAEGQKKLEGRIERAVREYCGAGATMTGTRVQSAGVAACVKDARAAARQQMAGLIGKDTQAGG